jgi:hypothetical protein
MPALRGGTFACPARGRPFAPRAAASPAPFPLNHSPPHLRAIAQGTYSYIGASSCISCEAVRLHALRVVALSLPAQQPAPPPSTLTILYRTSAPLRRARSTQALAARPTTHACLADSKAGTARVAHHHVFTRCPLAPREHTQPHVSLVYRARRCVCMPCALSPFRFPRSSLPRSLSP